MPRACVIGKESEKKIFPVTDNVYEVEEIANVSGAQVTLKGSADGYVLAVWNADGYAYAVSVTKKITKEEMLQIVEEIVKK